MEHVSELKSGKEKEKNLLATERTKLKVSLLFEKKPQNPLSLFNAFYAQHESCCITQS